MSGYKKDTNFGKHELSTFTNPKNLNEVSSRKLSRTMSDTSRSDPEKSNFLLNMLRPDVVQNQTQLHSLPGLNPSSNPNAVEKPVGSPLTAPKQPFFNSFNPFDFLEATSPLLQRQSPNATGANSITDTTRKKDVRSPLRPKKRQDTTFSSFERTGDFFKIKEAETKPASPLHPSSIPAKEERRDLEEYHFSQFTDDNKLPHEVYSIDPPLGRSFTLPPSCVSSPLLTDSFYSIAKANLPYSCFYEPLTLADKKKQYAAYVDQNLDRVCVSNDATKKFCTLGCESQVVYLGFGEDKSSNVYLLAVDCDGKASVWNIDDSGYGPIASLVLSIHHPLLRGCTWVSRDSNLIGFLVKNKFYVIQVPLIRNYMKLNSIELIENSSVLIVETPSTVVSCSLSKDKTVLALLVKSKVYLYRVALSIDANIEKQLLSVPFAFIDLCLPSPADCIFFLSTSRKDGTYLDRVLCISYNRNSTLFLFDLGCRQVTQEINLKNENRKFSPHLLGVSKNHDLIISVSGDYLDIFSYHASSPSSDLDHYNSSSFIMAALNSDFFGESGYIGAVMSKTILNDGILYSNLISENNDELNLLLALTSGYYLLAMDADCFSKEGKSLNYPIPEQPILASACLEKADKEASIPNLEKLKLPNSVKEIETAVSEYASNILNSSSTWHLESMIEAVTPQNDEVFSFVNMLLKKRANEKLKERLPNQIASLIKQSLGSHLNSTINTQLKQTVDECIQEPLDSYVPTAFKCEEPELLKNSLVKIKSQNQDKSMAMSALATRVSSISTILDNKNTYDGSSYPVSSNDISDRLNDLSKMIDATKNEEALIYFTKFPNVSTFRMLKRIPDYALDECSFVHLLTFIYTLSTFEFEDDDLKKLCIQLMSRATSRLRAMEAPHLTEKVKILPELFPTVVDITLKNVETILAQQIVVGYETKYEFLKTSLKSLQKELSAFYDVSV
ncbi:fungal protein [Schizosaccharomyces cryophilus OY26]|uniref:Fungal protein n=1 Tax=Schizosaccharomyces cryophilus (strain OY26 / ATCC MYA-4695 / CBS 11777 / NBRC 106824 / NRRL Y48691) TaxID=653667 RepID=S9XFT1_SCHCR|nr:uncharacterized protein SPOG_01818 [Schizosaccharomyces cryophilus OY26]EPY52496.1 fungal protein [Schizosaccharomyces cryophilus OY26]